MPYHKAQADIAFNFHSHVTSLLPALSHQISPKRFSQRSRPVPKAPCTGLPDLITPSLRPKPPALLVPRMPHLATHGVHCCYSGSPACCLIPPALFTAGGYLPSRLSPPPRHTPNPSPQLDTHVLSLIVRGCRESVYRRVTAGFPPPSVHRHSAVSTAQ